MTSYISHTTASELSILWPNEGDKWHLYEWEREREAFTNQIKEVEKGMGLFLLCGVDNNRQAEMTIRWRRKDSIISLILSPQTIPSKRKGLRSVNKVGGGWVWEGEKKARKRMTRTITRRLKETKSFLPSTPTNPSLSLRCNAISHTQANTGTKATSFSLVSSVG